MTRKEIAQGLRNKSITFANMGHSVNPIIEQLESPYGGNNLERKEIYCFNCGKNLGLKMVDNVILTFPEECITVHIQEKKKLEADINLPTGEVVFQNFFRKDKLHHGPTNEFGYSDINSLFGRKTLMDYLASQDVGYGQMGNMSVSIYSNLEDEILVCDAYMDEKISNLNDVEQYPEDFEEEDIKQAKIDGKFAKAFQEYIDKRQIVRLGKISLSMWRWVCADMSVLEKAKEKIDDDAIVFNVNKGTWHVEHYFEFAYRGNDNSIYSKLTFKPE